MWDNSSRDGYDVLVSSRVVLSRLVSCRAVGGEGSHRVEQGQGQ